MVLKLFEEEKMEMTARLGGAILRKAEFANDFTGVYSMIFERLNQLGELEGDQFLAVLGEIGG